MTPKIQELLNQITDLYLAKGVQPSDLVLDLFEDGYLEMKTTQIPTGVCVVVSYLDIDDDDNQIKHFLRYHYDKQRYLQHIEESIDNKLFKTIWCRKQSYQEKIEQFIDELYKQKMSQKQINKILSTLPLELYVLVQKNHLAA